MSSCDLIFNWLRLVKCCAQRLGLARYCNKCFWLSVYTGPPVLALLGMTDPLLAQVLAVSLERLPYPWVEGLQESR